MRARSLNIEEKHRQFTPILASLADFTFSEGQAVDAEVVLTNPAINLYCLDDASQQAIFVELPADADLATAPFVYQMQVDQALQLIAVPYDTFWTLAQKVPDPERLILIFSCGRSGSTLLSHVFNRLDNALSLSEPDVASQFVQLRSADGSRDTELRDLLDSTVRMLFKPGASKTPTTGAIKYRAEATSTMDFYHATFPHARSLYLYRDAVGYVASFSRVFHSLNMPEYASVEEYIPMISAWEHTDASRFLAYLAPGATQVSITQQLTLLWLNHMENYLAQYQPGIPVLAVRYADLNAQREQALGAIFDYCGLAADQVSKTLGVFEGDSQAGTTLARENPTEGNALRLTDTQISEIKQILARHPVLKTPDFVLPGTLHLPL